MDNIEQDHAEAIAYDALVGQGQRERYECSVCGDFVPFAGVLCARCTRDFERHGLRFCPVCGDTLSHVGCDTCAGREHAEQVNALDSFPRPLGVLGAPHVGDVAAAPLNALSVEAEPVYEHIGNALQMLKLCGEFTAGHDEYVRVDARAYGDIMARLELAHALAKAER